MFYPEDPNRFRSARDQRGVLKDGKAIRVSQFMRDHDTVRRQFTDGRQFWDAERHSLVVTDADATLTNGNRPGWRVTDSAINQQARLEAYRDTENYLNIAYKNPSTWSKP